MRWLRVQQTNVAVILNGNLAIRVCVATGSADRIEAADCELSSLSSFAFSWMSCNSDDNFYQRFNIKSCQFL